MILPLLRRLGPLPLAVLSGIVIVLCAMLIVGGLDVLLKGRVLPVDILIGALTGLALGPVAMYLPLRLARRVEMMRIELDAANRQLSGEAETLRHLSSQLARANDRLGFAQTLARIAYYEIDLASHRVAGSAELFGLFPAGGTAPPTLAGWLEQVHAEHRNGLSEALHRCAASADSVELDFRLAANGDSERWLHLYGELVPGDAGAPGSVVGFVQDLSELRRAEALRRANERLATDNAALTEADRIKDEFLATMSHELRTPLTGVLSLSEALKEEAYGPLSAEQREKMAIIESSGRHLLRLINDILDLTRIRSGKAEVLLESVSLCQAGRQAFATVQRLAVAKGIEAILPQWERDHVVRADPLRLKQILINLLANAIKFTPAGGRIGLEFASEPDRSSAACTVWDTGIGIAAEDLGKLFQPFVQLDSDLARAYGGAGLGLCLAQQLAELQGGRVTVTSQPGGGSRFTVHLPLADRHAPAMAEAPSRLPSGGVCRLAGKVLVVEDDAMNCDIYREYLELKGFSVSVAENGEQALIVAARERPDVIVMDIQMPAIDGIEATRRLRAAGDPILAATPVIALSALAMPGGAQRCLEAGCDAYLAKPVRLEELFIAVAAQVERRRAGATPKDRLADSELGPGGAVARPV